MPRTGQIYTLMPVDYLRRKSQPFSTFTVFTDLLQKKFPANPWTVPALVNIEPALLFSSLFKPVPLVSSLIGPTPPGLPPPIQCVPTVTLIESVPRAIESVLAVIESIPPPFESIPPVVKFVPLPIESVPLVIESALLSNQPALSFETVEPVPQPIIPQILTEQKNEEKETVYHETIYKETECFGSVLVLTGGPYLMVPLRPHPVGAER